MRSRPKMLSPLAHGVFWIPPRASTSRSAAARGNALVKTILEGLLVRGVPAYRLNAGAYRPRPGAFLRYGFPGQPDIVAFLADGRSLWVECKSGSGRLSSAQQEFADMCARRQVPYVCARRWEDVEEFLS